MWDSNLQTRIIKFLEDYIKELVTSGYTNDIATIAPSLLFFNIENRIFEGDKNASVMSFEAFPGVYENIEFEDWDDVTKHLESEVDFEPSYLILMVAEFDDIGDSLMCVYFDSTHQKLQGMVLDLGATYLYNFDVESMTPWITYRLDEATHV